MHLEVSEKGARRSPGDRWQAGPWVPRKILDSSHTFLKVLDFSSLLEMHSGANSSVTTVFTQISNRPVFRKRPSRCFLKK